MPARAVPLAAALVLALAATAVMAVRTWTDSARPAGGALERVATGSIRPGDPLPSPRGRTVLRLAGVESGAIALDLATLDAMPRVRFSVHEPFVQRRMTFEGVPLADLFSLAGVPAGSRLDMSALDGYSVTLAERDLRAARAVLATRADGRTISLRHGGPVRVVFPSGPGIAANEDSWIGSVNRMRVAR